MLMPKGYVGISKCQSYVDDQNHLIKGLSDEALIRELYSGDIQSFILNSYSGKLEEIPATSWGVNNGLLAKDLISAGRAGWKDKFNQLCKESDAIWGAGPILIEESVAQKYTKPLRTTSKHDIASEDHANTTINIETNYRKWLTERMQSGPKELTKSKYQSKAKIEHGVGSKAFLRAWDRAIDDSGNPFEWNKSGPTPKTKKT